MWLTVLLCWRCCCMVHLLVSHFSLSLIMHVICTWQFSFENEKNRPIYPYLLLCKLPSRETLEVSFLLLHFFLFFFSFGSPSPCRNLILSFQACFSPLVRTCPRNCSRPNKFFSTRILPLIWLVNFSLPQACFKVLIFIKCNFFKSHLD